MKLDTTRPYGVVCGPAGHRYEQDGYRFDAEGNAIGDRGQMAPPEQVEIRHPPPEPEPEPKALVVDADDNGYMTRAEIMAALDHMAVPYAKRDSRAALLEKLRDAQ